MKSKHLSLLSPSPSQDMQPEDDHSIQDNGNLNPSLDENSNLSMNDGYISSGPLKRDNIKDTNLSL